MPNRDGTGPYGQGAGTGRLRGGCAVDRSRNANNPRRGARRGYSCSNGPKNPGGWGRSIMNNNASAR
ncbi:DUF5320 domain-containing protein [Syntrophomonas zehnderi]|uniref:DUF5320 domain-containing protein n=1 Tax=Syntrophomonas zehnderi TaxID=404335 RepID=UPI0018DB3ADE